MIAYVTQLGLAMLALYLLGGLIGGLCWRWFGAKGEPAQPEAKGPSHSA